MILINTSISYSIGDNQVKSKTHREDAIKRTMPKRAGAIFSARVAIATATLWNHYRLKVQIPMDNLHLDQRIGLGWMSVGEWERYVVVEDITDRMPW
jgi:hypothetical protein